MPPEMEGSQLHMLWPTTRLHSPPRIELPVDYALRTYHEEDQEQYLKVMHDAGFESFDAAAIRTWQRRILPAGWFVVIHRPSGDLAATAMTVHRPQEIHPYGGELGWVAARPEHTGRRLGRAVCAAVVGRFVEAGYRRIYLQTDDFRLPAIKTYLRLGFLPFIHAPDMEARWQAIFQQLDWPFTPEVWPRHAKADASDAARPDADHLDRYPKRHQWHPDRPHRGYALMGDVDAFGDESLYQPSRLGEASVSPSRLRVGSREVLRLVYTAGETGLPEGARVTYVMRGQSPLGDAETEIELHGPARCTLARSPKGLGFVLEQGALHAGESVELVSEPAQWTPLAGRREFKVVIKAGAGPEQRLPAPLVIELLPEEPARLEATVPPTRRADEALPVNLTLRDAHDNRVPWDGPVLVAIEGREQSICAVQGLARTELPASTASPLTVNARTVEPALETRSNPSLVADDLQLYVGDLHVHDFMSEAEGYPDEVYRWAIEDRNLDFVSVVPQVHGWLDNETWTVSKYMAERFLDEGRFVTFLGFEWQHSGYGDKVIHYLGGDQPYLPVDDERYKTPAKLYEALRQSDAFVISHHLSYPIGSWVPGTDFDVLEMDVERLVEIWSMHGSSEGYDPDDRPLEPWVRTSSHDEARSVRDVMAALRQGVRVGFVAGSDTHSGRPGGSAREPRPHWGGLAAVWAAGLTRRDLFAALRDRRTYALTGARILLKMHVNGAWMGSELPAAEQAHLQIDVWAPAPIATVEIMKNARPLQVIEPQGDEYHGELEDRTEGNAFYHVRVTLVDGELAVCSPVWIG